MLCIIRCEPPNKFLNYFLPLQHTLEESGVDFGRIELFSTHTEYFSLDNVNPVEVRLKSWGSNATWTHVDLVGMHKGSKEDLARIKDFDSLRKSVSLPN